MSTAAAVVKFHISLNAADLARSIAFYRTLFGCEPAKVRNDYAKFELDEPPVVVSLVPLPAGGGGTLNHVGLRLLDSQALVDVQMRLELAGFSTEREDGVECCYSKQTKFWVRDPDGTLWELYVLHGDADEHAGSASCENGLVGNSSFRTEPWALPVLNDAPSTARAVWRHLLTEPLPERIAADDQSLDEVELQGTLNLRVADERLRQLLCDARRVLRPGGCVSAHALTSDRPLTDRPQLPGPAAAVEQVRTPDEVRQLFASAGFAEVRFLKLGPKPCFIVSDCGLRETKLSASKIDAGWGGCCG